ncbi:MAG TPA: hypothetical protein VI479_05315, partial [Blastocatellia bacterium]
YEVRLNAMAGGFRGGGFRGGGFRGGRGGARAGGGRDVADDNPQFRIPDVRQTVSVANGSPSSVTLNLNLSQQ